MSTHTDEYLSAKKAAQRLDIDVSTLYRHYGKAIHSGRVRNLTIGRARRLHWGSLLEEVERQSGGGHARA
jgi:hypothetical protein